MLSYLNRFHFSGKCINASDGSHTCACLRGFYGPKCSQIDPCAAVSANPCGNGGTCVRYAMILWNFAAVVSQRRRYMAADFKILNRVVKLFGIHCTKTENI